MLNREQAQQRLDAVKLKDNQGWAHMFSRLFSLPAPLREIGLNLRGLDKNGRPLNNETRQDITDETARKFIALSEGEHATLFDAWFGPTLGRFAAYAYGMDRPYQIGWARKAFRAPRNTHLQQLTGWSWVWVALDTTLEFDQPLTWFAEHAAYLGYRADALGWLFAAAIDLGGADGDAIFNILITSADGTHPVGMMGRHVTRGLLAASRPDGWAFVERLLLAAQRQEGLRQVILESIDECHPVEFKRMLHLILDHNLIRFSATVRALDVWLGYQLQVESAKRAEQVIGQLLHWLEQDDARKTLLQDAHTTPDLEQLYLALWASAYTDAPATVLTATNWLGHARAEFRFVAVYLLDLLGLDSMTAPQVLRCLTDSDLRVCARAFQFFRQGQITQPALFEVLEHLLGQLPSDRTFEGFVWPWMQLKLERTAIADRLITALDSRSPKLLIGHIPLMSPYRRGAVAELLAKQKPWDADTRQVLFKLMGDPASAARERVFKLFEDEVYQPTDEEVRDVERLLTRKSAELRRAAITLLLHQGAERARASAERLESASNAEQRAAGAEISSVLDAKASPAPVLSLKDALGLMNPGDRTPVTTPKLQNVRIVTQAAIDCLKSLDALIDTHAQTLIQVPRMVWITPSDDDMDEANKNASPKVEMPLGNVGHHMPMPRVKRSAKDDLVRLPLADIWEGWWHDRPQALRDTDGLELLRALVFQRGTIAQDDYGWRNRPHSPERDAIMKALGFLTEESAPKLRYATLVTQLLTWLIRLHPTPTQADFILDVAEHSLALIDQGEVWRPQPKATGTLASTLKSVASGLLTLVNDSTLEVHVNGTDERTNNLMLLRVEYDLWCCLNFAQEASAFLPVWTQTHELRLWRLLHWADEPYPDIYRHRPRLEMVLEAWAGQHATDADVLDQLIGERTVSHYSDGDFYDLRTLTGRIPGTLLKTYPQVQPLVERCKARILDIELARGELPTPATPLAMCIRSLDGMDILLRLLVALDREGITRGRFWRAEGKSQVLSHLVQVCMPKSTDTPDIFAGRCAALGIREEHLIDLGLFAPQWARFVECALGWPGAADAMWWLHAHTKERAWHVEQDVRAAWQAEISEHTPLKPEDLLDGAADVAWFKRVYAALGSQRWEAIYAAAKFASTGIGHSRARQFADAMLGQLDEAQLTLRIKTKRHQDSVRALGLLPVRHAERDAGGSGTVLRRYTTIQEFVRGAKQFGSQRQASEKLSARIGLQNLARSAGYPDPVRLEWAMEIEALGDVAQGPVAIEAGGATATLSVSAVGEAKLDIEKGGKPVKTVPAPFKKLAAFAELKQQQRELVKQAARMRASLEQSMVRGDTFTASELRTLFTHPILKVMLEQLVFITGDGLALGYPMQAGTLLDHAGSHIALDTPTLLRIAHPLDLLKTGEWHQWQQECYLHERIQPFKQVFREIYLPTRDEVEAPDHSRRYAGHQVNPRQAAALLGTRAWVVRMEEGASRAFHDEGLVAWVDTNTGFLTPAEVEPPVIETVHFTRRGQWQPIVLTEVPPRIFSEVMRDLDLVVSVAHVGGVDPEASASTVEMRTAMLRESSRLLKLSNVDFKGSHALIAGKLNRYSVHLGSGVAHQQPGGFVCIVPVHAQHRGRLFLPFMDNDPRTAEVLSKVLLLARDSEIKDPSILEQITRVA